jgi:hypothetical protein
MAETKPAKKPAAKAEAKNDTKLSQFLTSKKLDPRRIMAASHKLETLTREDRTIKLVKRLAKKAEDQPKEPKETRKPRSGRAVTPRAMATALQGGTISGPTKQRILRAVNHLLEQKKQEKVELKTLF